MDLYTILQYYLNFFFDGHIGIYIMSTQLFDLT